MLKNGFDRRGWCLNTLFCAFSLSEEPIKPGPYRVSKRTLRVRPETSRLITELSEHEADGGEAQERERLAV